MANHGAMRSIFALSCSARYAGGERALEPRADGGAAFARLDVPGEGDEVAPGAVGLEERYCGVEVAARESGREGFEPARGGRSHVGILGNKSAAPRGANYEA